MEEESWGRNPGGGVAEGKSLRRHLEGIWEASGRHLGGIWEVSGRHLGGIWKPSGSLLGSIWRQLAGWRLKRHLEGRSQIMCLTLEQNAKVPLEFKFHEGLLRVPSIMTAYLQSDMGAGFSTVTSYRSRALYQDHDNPIS